MNDDLRRVIKEIQPAGFVLFDENEEPAQVFELNRELRSLVAENPFIAVDQRWARAD